MSCSDSDESYNSYDDDDSDYFSSVDEYKGECTDGVDDDDDDDMDESCQSDGDVGGDVVSDDDDDDEPQAERNDKGYVFETEADVRKRQDEVTARVSELLSIPWGLAAVFLRHCRWDAERLENEWFSDERRIREAVGLAAGQGDAGTAVSDRPLTCTICFDGYPAGEMISAGCAHYFCRECWGGYIHAAVGDGSRCLVLRCPDPSCSAPVVRELVREVAAGGGEDQDDDRARYEVFVVRSYVEEGTSKYIRWCPGPGCTLAVRSEPGSALYEVACECKHAFCFRCGEEAHRPATCDTAREWAAKNRSDGETANWVLDNTKHCPRCRRPIEKNQGCNHMTCGAPCLHNFCWICLGPWSEHGNSYYTCNRYVADKPAEHADGEKRRREHAKASLDRYMFFYERWVAHGESMRKARRDLERLESGALRGFAEANGVSQAELGCLEEAYALIVESRRVLRWTYPLVYYLDPVRDGAKSELCEHIQSVAEESLETLHRCVESEWNELKETGAAPGAEFDAASADEFAAAFKEYMKKLFALNSALRNHLKGLVEGFESGIPECRVQSDLVSEECDCV